MVIVHDPQLIQVTKGERGIIETKNGAGVITLHYILHVQLGGWTLNYTRYRPMLRVHGECSTTVTCIAYCVNDFQPLGSAGLPQP